MFAVAPQTVPVGTMTLTFRPDGDDVSRSVLDVVSADGTHVLTFNTRGGLIGQRWLPADDAQSETPEPEPAKGSDDGEEVKTDEGQDYAPVEAGEKQPA